MLLGHVRGSAREQLDAINHSCLSGCELRAPDSISPARTMNFGSSEGPGLLFSGLLPNCSHGRLSSHPPLNFHPHLSRDIWRNGRPAAFGLCNGAISLPRDIWPICGPAVGVATILSVAEQSRQI